MDYILGYRDGLEGTYRPELLEGDARIRYMQGHKVAWQERQQGTLPVIDSKLVTFGPTPI